MMSLNRTFCRAFFLLKISYPKFLAQILYSAHKCGHQESSSFFITLSVAGKEEGYKRWTNLERVIIYNQTIVGGSKFLNFKKRQGLCLLLKRLGPTQPPSKQAGTLSFYLFHWAIITQVSGMPGNIPKVC